MPALGQRYGSLFGLPHRSRGGEGQGGVRDDLEKYESLFPAGRLGGKGKERDLDPDAEKVRILREMREMDEVASLEKRWTTSWKQPLLAS